ncbi:MAG: hypothetical protein IPL39_15230 [Opitutaceae bacterium]|nr:hypothetical protein [Opitutaceae bacterium]
MITTADARRAAQAWLQEEAPKYPGLVGAVLAGSTSRRDPSTPHPAGSDVDLFLYVDAEVPSDILEPRGRFAPRKLAFRGVVLEPSFHNARILADPETVLGDRHLAPLFTEPCILLDPSGRLASLAAAVTPEFFRRRHAQRRLTQVLEAATPAALPFAVPDTPALRAPCWRNVAFAFSVMRCAQAVLAADLRYPTTRRSFVVAREVLAPARRDDLADELLRLLGSLDLARAEVENLAAETEHTYDVTINARRTPVPMEWNISHDARELERAAIRELIDAGHHREALFQLLLVRTVAQGILENDGTESVRESSRLDYRRLLSALGIDGDTALASRAQAIRAFMPCLRETCERLLAHAPGLQD